MIKLVQTRKVDLQVVHRLDDGRQLSRSIEKVSSSSSIKSLAAKKIAIPIKGGIVLHRIDEISYCKAEGNYTEVCLSNGHSLLLSMTIKNVESLLSNDAFIRCHQSYIINKHHVRQFTIDGGIVLDQIVESIPVSRRKKKSVLMELTNLS